MFGSSIGAPTPATKPSLFTLNQPTAAPPRLTFDLGSTQQPQQQQQSGGIFGNQQQTQSQSGGLFGQSTQQGTGSSGGGGLFGSSLQPQQQSTSLFGAASSQPQQSNSLFGTSAQPQQSTSLFGASTQPQQSGGLFSTSTQPQKSGFGGFGPAQPQQSQQSQRPLDQTLRFGQTQQDSAHAQNASQALWEEGRGLGVYRSVPDQINIVKDKWDPGSLASPLRTYLFQHVHDESEALRYRPAQGEDENKWEEAVSKRPGPTWVPLLVRGFWELGKRAQIQMEAIQRCNMMLQEINTSLDVQLDAHRQHVANRLAESRRRYVATSSRTMSLAVKIQILRNRGYVMDNAEEELKNKLEKLEREVLDPSLNAREQEIWARMLGVRERANRLKTEMAKIAPGEGEDQPVLDENTLKAAKDTLEAYDIQLRHLYKELQLVEQEFKDWEQMSNGRDQEHPRRR